MEPSFGWIPSSPEKIAQNDRYPLRLLAPEAPEAVEVILPYPPLVNWYNQGAYGACVGYSCSWQMSIYNTPNKYNGLWLYRAARKNEGDDPNVDEGAQLWSGMDVLRKQGHCLDKTTTPVLAEGIESYYWCKNINDVRSALNIRRPVVFGINWYQGFMDPETVNGEYWIGRRSWGGWLGGHAICCVGISDQRQAVLLRNSWGSDWAGGKDVWIAYTSITTLLGQNGECAVGVDRGSTPPPPPPEEDTITMKTTYQGKKYKGTLKP